MEPVTTSHIIFLRSILTLSSYICLCIPRCLLKGRGHLEDMLYGWIILKYVFLKGIGSEDADWILLAQDKV
jgi:hypothetical protein